MLGRDGGPHWDTDLQYGKAGEWLVDHALRDARVEIKRSRFMDTWLYVELEQRRQRRTEYEQSGLSVTHAEYWAFVKPSDVIILAPVPLLRRAVASRSGNLRRGLVEERDGSNPTRGMLLWLAELMEPPTGPAS